MEYSGTSVLVSGADGFIGSHLVEALLQKGAEVTALAQYNSFGLHGWLDSIDRDGPGVLRIVRGDIRDAHHILKICQGQTVIFHLAALIAIPHSYDSPSAYVATNVEGTLNLLQGALAAGSRRIVHTSTSEVYGSALYTPIDEAHPLQGQSPYSASKIGADMMVEAFHRSFGAPAITLRPFNTYGPRQSERAVISTIIRQVLDQESKELRLGDLSTIRDFTYVADTVQAFLAAGALPAEAEGQVFNGGTGRACRIGDIVEIVQHLAGTDKPVIHEAIRMRPAKSEVRELLADPSRLHQACGWKATTSLEDGLAKTLHWWQRNVDIASMARGYLT